MDSTAVLTQTLRATIAERGPIPFREFMAAALYHPEHGYYSSGRAAIGRGGDFITSVSVGRLFGTLLARRDSHVLVSARAAFLPIRKDGKATFWPVIFNYQSYEKHPAVLTIMVTREGTSMTVIDNARDTVTEAYFNPPGTNGAKQFVPDLKGNKITPRLAVRYKPSEEASVYASYTKGYKAGVLDVDVRQE